MIRYYKLFDLLNRKGYKKSDLRSILSPKTVAKLSKGEFVSGEVIDKICRALECQPGDIMEVVEEIEFKKLGFKEVIKNELGKEQQRDIVITDPLKYEEYQNLSNEEMSELSRKAIYKALPGIKIPSLGNKTITIDEENK